MQTAQLERLRRDTEIAAKFWGRIFSGLGAMTYRERGEAGLSKLWVMLLSQHQKGFYDQGLEKIGISPDEPPAVKAAKYHYLTNQIGGLRMEYVEETPTKVWIRYLAPMWTYAGVSMLALPGRVRRDIFSAWHPRNGERMGCKRLGWVSTKFIMEGDPYDEGYFIEYDHDLRPGEEMAYEVVHQTPEFDPSKAPALDEDLWPAARQYKARRNWSREYVNTTTSCLLQMYGEEVTHFLLSQTMRGIAIQYTHELMSDLDIDGKDARSIAEFFSVLLSACDQDFDIEHHGDNVHRIVLHSIKPFRPETASEGLRRALFQFNVMAARVLNGRVAVTRTPTPMIGLADSETWTVEDAGRWLW